MKQGKIIKMCILLLSVSVLWGCVSQPGADFSSGTQSTEGPTAGSTAAPSVPATVPTVLPTQPATKPAETAPTETVPAKKKLIAIDAGHQGKANLEKEPVAPGSSEMKYKVSGGTYGRFSGLRESELALEIALFLQRELENRGYEVLMIRTTQDVNISNAERAEMANDAGADAFIRIHADGSEDASVHGATALCQTENNPYCGNLYTQSRLLSESLLEGLTARTGAKKRGVAETDRMSGINWCQVPVSIIEVGFMTNREEDLLLATEEYQMKIALGLADGVDSYFASAENEG